MFSAMQNPAAFATGSCIEVSEENSEKDQSSRNCALLTRWVTRQLRRRSRAGRFMSHAITKVMANRMPASRNCSPVS